MAMVDMKLHVVIFVICVLTASARDLSDSRRDDPASDEDRMLADKNGDADMVKKPFFGDKRPPGVKPRVQCTYKGQKNCGTHALPPEFGITLAQRKMTWDLPTRFPKIKKEDQKSKPNQQGSNKEEKKKVIKSKVFGSHGGVCKNKCTRRSSDRKFRCTTATHRNDFCSPGQIKGKIIGSNGFRCVTACSMLGYSFHRCYTRDDMRGLALSYCSKPGPDV